MFDHFNVSAGDLISNHTLKQEIKEKYVCFHVRDAHVYFGCARECVGRVSAGDRIDIIC